jgi:hypothetical protein
VIQHESGSLLHAVAEHDASFVIAGSDSLSMADAGSLLAARPDVKLVAIAENGRRWYAYEMRPHQEPLGEASPERLVQLIRDHAAAPAVGT